MTTAAPVPATAHEAAALAQANNAKLTLDSVVPDPPRARHMLRLGAHMEAVSGLLAANAPRGLIPPWKPSTLLILASTSRSDRRPTRSCAESFTPGMTSTILTDGSEASAATARLDSVGSTQ